MSIQEENATKKMCQKDMDTIKQMLQSLSERLDALESGTKEDSDSEQEILDSGLANEGVVNVFFKGTTCLYIGPGGD